LKTDGSAFTIGCSFLLFWGGGGRVVDLQVHTFRFSGHSPADPEHERGRKDEKKWARAEADPLAIFESAATASGLLTADEMDAAKARVKAVVKKSVDFATASPSPPASLAKELEYPDKPNTDYNLKVAPASWAEVTKRTVDPAALAGAEAHVAFLTKKALAGDITIGDAVNLAVLEEMIRDPHTVMHAEDLQVRRS
jgi:hypothetical protein